MSKKPPPPPPPQNRSRSRRLTIELSEEEAGKLEGFVTDTGLSRSDIMRQALRGYPSTKRGE